MRKRVINNRDELELFYHTLIPKLQLEARRCGYALGIHGSIRRDLDLIAVPWVVRGARTPAFLAKRLHFKATGIKKIPKYYKTAWGEKPHGRKAIILLLPNVEVTDYGLALLDLSVMPRV